MKIAHADGEWFRNEGQFPFVDAENGVLYEPMVAVKARATKWLEMQSAVIKRIPDPLVAAAPEVAAPKAPVPEVPKLKVEAPKK